MTELSLEQITQRRKRKRNTTFAIVCAGYLMIAILIISYFDRAQSNTGFSKLSALGMIAVFLGAFHVAGRCKRGWVFVLIGGIAGMLFLPLYLMQNSNSYYYTNVNFSVAR